MKMFTALTAFAALALGAGFASAAPAASTPAAAVADKMNAGKPETTQFDNWRLSCRTPENATQEVCELDYLFAAKAQADAGNPDPKPQVVLTVGIIKPANTEMPVMIMKAELGAFLQPAPMIKVPNHKDVVVQFQTCSERGCTTLPVGLEKEFVDAMKAAEAAMAKDPKAPMPTISIGARQTTADKKVQFGYLPMNFDIKGFTKGLAALEAKAAAAAMPAKDAGKKDSGKKDSGKKK